MLVQSHEQNQFRWFKAKSIFYGQFVDISPYLFVFPQTIKDNKNNGPHYSTVSRLFLDWLAPTAVSRLVIFGVFISHWKLIKLNFAFDPKFWPKYFFCEQNALSGQHNISKLSKEIIVMSHLQQCEQFTFMFGYFSSLILIQ